jgi:hypothetical protein
MLRKSFGKSLVIASLALLGPAAFVSFGMAQEPSRILGSIRFEQYQGRYAIEFPSCQLEGMKVNTKNGEMSADVDVDGAGYIVICLDLRDIGPADKVLDAVEADSVRSNHARIVRKVPVTLGAVSGREVELANETGWQRISRNYIVGTRIYCVAAQARGGKLNRGVVKRFLDSFAFLPGNAPGPTVMPAPSAAPLPPTAPLPPAEVAGADTAPQPAPGPSSAEPLNVREQIVRMLHGNSYEDLAPIPPTAPAPSLQPTNAPAAIRQYVNRAGRYHVDFPKAPTESSGTDPSGSVLYQAMLEDQGVYYGVTYRDLQKSEIDWARTQPEGLAAFHAIWKDGVIRQQGGTVVSEKHVDVAGHAGYQVEFAFQNKGRLVGRIVVVGTRCYRFAVWGTGITGNDPLVRQFLDSFGIIE